MSARRNRLLVGYFAVMLSGCGTSDTNPPVSAPPNIGTRIVAPRILDPLEGIPASVWEPPPELPAEPEPESQYKPRPSNSLTFARDIAPIVWANCAVCHHAGALGPFPLSSYDEVKKHAKQIVEVTSERYMPPWQPAHAYNQLVGSRRLSDEQIGTIAQWFREGAKPGDLNRVPPLPKFPIGWRLGTPSQVVKFPQPFPLRADGTDVFRNLVIPDVTGQEQYVKAVEFLVNGAPVVHHVEIRIDESDASLEADRRDEEPGFAGMEFEGAHYPDGHFLNWVPGKTPVFEPKGRAWRMESGTDLVVQLHMIPSGKPQLVNPEVGLYYTNDPPSEIAPLNLGLSVKEMDIPAGQANYTVRDAYRLPIDVDVIDVMPHAHFVCRDMKGYAVLPDGRKLWLIRIKDWDFNWQDDYRYETPIALPRGTVLVMQYTFDNSGSNPRNPNKPPKPVAYGPKSSEEMADLWIRVVPKGALDRRQLGSDHQRHRTMVDVARLERQVHAQPESGLHQKLARKYDRAGDKSAALWHYQEAARLAPLDSGAHQRFGLALHSSGETASAASELRRAAELDPKDTGVRFNLGLISASLGTPDDAAKWFREALAIRPDYLKARTELARVLVAQERFDEATTELRAALAIENTDVAANSGLAAILASHPDAAKRKPAEARDLASSAVGTSNRRNADALRALAAAHAALGDFDQAQAIGREAANQAYGTPLSSAIARDLEQYARRQPPSLFGAAPR